jgi:exosome complex component RRP4
VIQLSIQNQKTRPVSLIDYPAVVLSRVCIAIAKTRSKHKRLQHTMQDFPHLVVPGQIIAVSSSAAGEDSFLRGHGTYIEHGTSNDGSTVQLRASVCGTVQRVNKLISVDTVALHTYAGQVGDLVVGRIVSIGNARWNVDIGGGVIAALPLSGVHLPGSVQRVRTAADALEMRQHLQEGDLVSCEVHKVLNHNNVMLHTRSVRYGKLENGVVVTVPAKLVPRRKTHYTVLCENQFQILLGCNGMIWMQRSNNIQGDSASATAAASTQQMGQQQELAEAEEQRRKVHAETVYSVSDRRKLARLANAVHCLRLTLSEITAEAVQEVYDNSLELMKVNVADMMLPENILQLTASRRT